MTQNGVTTTYTYDANNRLLTESKAGDVILYQYDANGNTLRAVRGGDGVGAYTYNLFGNQVSYTPTGVVYTYYTYRPDGLRHSIGDTIHLWDGTNIVADVKGNDVTVYIRGANLICADDGEETYYHFNAHGDVVVLTNESGNKTKSYAYNAFGVEENPSALDDNPFRYCGEYFDKVNEKIYLRARYYDAGQGRFTQEDPIRDGYNWYSYCANNPIRFIDPTGKSMEDFIVGLTLTLDAGIFGGLVITILEAFADINPDYVPDDEVDYYLGRVIGDILSMVSGIKSLIAGLQTILASIAAGGFTTVSSGGTLSVAGVTICVEGVAAGAVVVEYGVLSTAAATANLGSDFDKLVQAYKKGKLYTTSNEVDTHKYRKRVSGKTGKEAADDVPDWARGFAPYVGEDGKTFAKRLMDEKYGAGNYATGPKTEYSKIQKWGDRGFEK